MKTQLELARECIITEAMKEAAVYDDVSPEFIREGIAKGQIVIYGNPNRKARVVGIGKGLKTKVNASIGTSPDIIDVEMEVKKAQTAEKYGADTLMELSTGGDLTKIRKRVLDSISLTVGTVPLYQAAIETNKKNPLYEQIDRLIDIMKKHDVILSLGNGLRAGAIHDSTDRAQIQELIINSEIAEYAQSKGVQIIVEGPGHIPIDEIEANVLIQKRLSNNAPFYMLGPITTDVAPGYDHISSAIGAALSSCYGADFICYVTPPEHLALPGPDDVREGVMAARIAAHVGDMVKLKDKAKNLDLKMGIARRDLDWKTQYETAITKERAQEIRNSRPPIDEDTCTMCGNLCSLKGVMKYYEQDLKKSRKKSATTAAF